jgi:hypothetical protein
MTEDEFRPESKDLETARYHSKHLLSYLLLGSITGSFEQIYCTY